LNYPSLKIKQPYMLDEKSIEFIFSPEQNQGKPYAI